jgi:hypothetical protein
MHDDRLDLHPHCFGAVSCSGLRVCVRKERPAAIDAGTFLSPAVAFTI